MELPVEQRQQMIDQRLEQYKVQLFQLSMDRTALESAGDTAGVQSVDKRIEAIRKAYSAVEGMV
ncbi:hypothetical protein D3C71_1134970 [compost metagenome]